tara:strand:- start:2857 stop:3051 length:195 start_codon:yes stop_codon:yes gene_type:complete
MNKTNLAYHFKDYEEIPKELHNDILVGNEVTHITEVSLEDINSMYNGLSLYNEITSIRKYMEDL